jgi:HlyD family secretion protein
MNSQLSPVHRLIGGVLILMVLTFGAWAAFGEIDIVVQAQGKLVPESAVKVSQPAEAGPVVAVLVRDGQRVHAGDVLLRLDSTQPSKDADALRSEASLIEARVAALQSSLQGQGAATKEAVVNQEFQLRLMAFREAQQVAQAAVARAEAELASSKEALAKSAPWSWLPALSLPTPT